MFTYTVKSHLIRISYQKIGDDVSLDYEMHRHSNTHTHIVLIYIASQLLQPTIRSIYYVLDNESVEIIIHFNSEATNNINDSLILLVSLI